MFDLARKGLFFVPSGTAGIDPPFEHHRLADVLVAEGTAGVRAPLVYVDSGNLLTLHGLMVRGP